jgi:glycosyltransferase involved in cell wall biosynthesis
MTPHVVHLIPELSGGGGGRAALAAARAASSCSDIRHRFLPLRPVQAAMRREAQASGFDVVTVDGREGIADAIASADITHLHFWNSPELFELLESALPPTRILLWPHVDGVTPPQVLPRALAASVDLPVATSPRARQCFAGVQSAAVIPPVPGWERVDSVERSAAPGFNVGYIGTVGNTKLHPRFPEICASVAIDDVNFILAGAGDALRSLSHRFAELGIGNRCRLLGPVEDVASVLADLDVFGYPLRKDGTASSDLVLKEAMYAGVPPVVLSDGAGELLVEDGVTGLVAPDPGGYARGIERLRSETAERIAIGEAAREEARRRWSLDVMGPLWARAYEELLDRPATGREAPFTRPRDPIHLGAHRFLRGLGSASAPFELSLKGTTEEAAIAHRQIAACSPVIGLGGGGILEYARRYPSDPQLALWSGLFLEEQGHPALAAGEYSRARRHGLEAVR